MFQDNVYCHVTSGLGAGLFAVLCGSPVDVVKSRMMGGWCSRRVAVHWFDCTALMFRFRWTSPSRA